MFRKIAAAAIAVCALASTASANMLKVVDITNVAKTTDDNPAIVLKPNTVYDFKAGNVGVDYYITVTCPPAKTVNPKFEKAFLSYITTSNPAFSDYLYVQNAALDYIAMLYAYAGGDGYGSQLTLICVNGRGPTSAFNYYY